MDWMTTKPPTYFLAYSETTFHLPSVICDMRDISLPNRLVAEKVIVGAPKISGGMEVESMALINVSVVRFGPAFCAALMKASMMV